MDNDCIGQEEIKSELKAIHPGYQNHVYKSPIDETLERDPQKFPNFSCEGCDKSDGCPEG